MENRTVKTNIIKDWIERNQPSGMFRLAEISGVSAWTIARTKAGACPKKQITRQLLSKALGVTEDELFPKSTKLGKEKAS